MKEISKQTKSRMAGMTYQQDRVLFRIKNGIVTGYIKPKKR